MDGPQGHLDLSSLGKFSALSQPPRETVLPAYKYPGILLAKLCSPLAADSAPGRVLFSCEQGQLRADWAMGHHVGKGLDGSLCIENTGI